MEKLYTALKSRKFWASVIGILSAVGLYAGGDIQAEQLTNAILVIVSTFTLGTGIESGLQSMSSKTE